jgi:hypothetical protein
MTFDIRKFLTENKITAASQEVQKLKEGGFDSKWSGGDSEKEYDWEKLASQRDPDSEYETEEESEKFRDDQDYEDEDEDEDEDADEDEDEDNRTEYEPTDAGRVYTFGELLKMEKGQKAFYSQYGLTKFSTLYLVTFNEIVKMDDGTLVAAFIDENGENIVQTEYRYENPNDETEIYQVKEDLYEFKDGFNTMGGRKGSKASDKEFRGSERDQRANDFDGLGKIDTFDKNPKINSGPEGEADYSDMGIDMPKDPKVKLGNKKRDLSGLSDRDFDPEMAIDQDDLNDIIANIKAAKGKITKVNPGKIEGDPAKETDINKMSDEEFEEYINSIEGMQDDEFDSKFGDRIKKESKASLVAVLKELMKKPTAGPNKPGRGEEEGLEEDWDDELEDDEDLNEKLSGNQKKLDKDGDGKISGDDFKMMKK